MAQFLAYRPATFVSTGNHFCSLRFMFRDPCIDQMYEIILKGLTDAPQYIRVILLHSNQRHVSATHLAICTASTTTFDHPIFYSHIL